MTTVPTLDVLVVGAGRMGLRYARAVDRHPAARLVALVGNTERGLEAAGAMFPNRPLHAGGLTASILGAYPSLAAVIVATPEWAHRDAAILALEHGLALMIEKPLAHALADARAIAAAARAAGVVAVPCHTVRFDVRYALARDLVRDGRIGRVRHLSARRNADRRAFSRVRGLIDPAFWLAPHDIDIMRWIVGSEVATVGGQVFGDPREPDGLSADVTFACGAVGHLECLWAAPPVAADARTCFLDIAGELGTLEVDGFAQGLRVHADGGVREAVDTVYGPILDDRIAGADAVLVDHFVRAALGWCPPACTLDDGVAAIAVASALSQATRRGTVVAVEA